MCFVFDCYDSLVDLYLKWLVFFTYNNQLFKISFGIICTSVEIMKMCVLCIARATQKQPQLNNHYIRLNIVYVSSLHHRRLMVSATRRKVLVLVVHLGGGHVHRGTTRCHNDSFVVVIAFAGWANTSPYYYSTTKKQNNTIRITQSTGKSPT